MTLHQPTPLWATSPGMRPARMRPFNMTPAPITGEQLACVQTVALGVFTDMSNAGFSLRETLAAIYLTGAQHAVAASASENSI